MIFYIFSFLYTFFFAINYSIKNISKHTFMLLLLLIFPAFLIAILRGNVGTDTHNYLFYFESIYSNDADYIKYEPGFQLISSLIMKLGFSPRFGMSLLSVLTTAFLCWSFSKSKQRIVFFCFVVFPLFYFDMTMNGLRYGLSFAIALNAIDALYEKRKKTFIVLALLAISVQYSAILLILVFLLD